MSLNLHQKADLISCEEIDTVIKHLVNLLDGTICDRKLVVLRYRLCLRKLCI